ncbi:family 43 glycosylhydrolase [Bifidobacterium cuniculi]|uniref:Beta-xylosidase n=1 Tax=Bifidobacterium cuniculi TaxID=1688 RepID=A0A087AKK3_9BIFI|nr:family 43 glycosylhydrolase [Bifidobacterium cuniculi]KFI59303.1 beta-xylosidase [Bifidobacterium cuniculi]
MSITNPILTGFAPDPALIRVGDTYVLANSTFDWWPAVNLHVSRDLANWTAVRSPIREARQLDLRGVASSFGVWAPDISYAHGRYWLVATNVKSVHASFTDRTTTYLCGSVPVPEGTRTVRLRTRIRTSRYTYDYAFDDGPWQETGTWPDARILSDDYAWQHGRGFFTGATVGLCTVDMSGYRASATFTGFDYRPEAGEVRP